MIKKLIQWYRDRFMKRLGPSSYELDDVQEELYGKKK